MIAIIDYKMGNLRSVAKAFETVGAQVEVTASANKLRKARGLILPGVGAFAAGMRHLRKYKLIPSIKEAVEAGRPLLGICLGMQLLFSESEEHGTHKGLDLIPGRVVRFDDRLKVPHMGWNQLIKKPTGEDLILKGIPNRTYFYFVHSYYAKPKSRNAAIGMCEYGKNFCAIARKDNTLGIQFHPEKSSDCGLKILKNFCKLSGEI